jgi:hypothetical protein
MNAVRKYEMFNERHWRKLNKYQIFFLLSLYVGSYLGKRSLGRLLKKPEEATWPNT